MEVLIKAIRYHDISVGHRVVGHENKCAMLHGHNYRIWFHCKAAQLDTVGRVIDFSVIKCLLCNWLEENWDHKFLLWVLDPLLSKVFNEEISKQYGVVVVDFNPTAENMAYYLLLEIAPILLRDTGVTVTKVVVEETRKCSASCEEAK